MRIKCIVKNLILYLLLITLLAVGINRGPVSIPKTVTGRAQTTSLTLDAPSLSHSIDFWAGRMSAKRSDVSGISMIRGVRTGLSHRLVLLFLLYVPALLSVFSRCSEKQIAFCDNRFIYRKPFTISFMQDADGRKRISYFPFLPVAIDIW